MVLTPDAVVMEIGENSASTGGTVTMEILPAGAVLEERVEPEDWQHSGREAFRHRNYRMLIVIGEIPTDYHLEAARRQIVQGELEG